MPAPATVPQPSTTRQRGRRRQGQMRAPFFRAEAPACLPACPPPCLHALPPRARTPDRRRGPATPRVPGSAQLERRECCAARARTGRAGPQQEQEAGPLRLTSARISTAHAPPQTHSPSVLTRRSAAPLQLSQVRATIATGVRGRRSQNCLGTTLQTVQSFNEFFKRGRHSASGKWSLHRHASAHLGPEAPSMR